MAEVNTFLEYLIKRLIDTEVANLAQEPVGSSRILAGNVSQKQITYRYLISLIPSVKGHLNIQYNLLTLHLCNNANIKIQMGNIAATSWPCRTLCFII